VWDAQTGQLLNTWIGHTTMICSMIFSLDNLKIASGGYDDGIKIWDAQSGQLLNTFGHASVV
jgi:WD40 repeat protein